MMTPRITTIRARRAIGIGLVGVIAATFVASPLVSSAADITPGQVTGHVFYDRNNNGLFDVDEPGIPGVVVNGTGPATVTDASGAWSLAVPLKAVPVRVSTGWYRSQCDGLNCPAGPGTDNDFSVVNEFIVSTADGATGATLDVGLLPDWPGTWPIPTPAIPGDPIPANAVDVATRLSWVWPGNAGNCYRTAQPKNHGCLVGDTPMGALQISNEGTEPLTGISGFIEVPANFTIFPAVTSTSPGNSPDITGLNIGAIDPLTNRAPFDLVGTLAPAAAAQYTLTGRIEPGTPLSPTPLRTSNPYPPNEMTVTITNPVDPDGCLADPCPRGTHDKQLPNDNTDFHGWQVVAALLVGKPAAADFGAVQAGAPATKSVGVRNAGPLSTAISGAEFTGPAAADYSLTDLTACQIAELGPGATCTVGLSFTPSTIGKRDASLVIHGPNTPDATIKLSGRLYVPPPKISAFTPTGARPGMPVDIMGTNFVSAYTQTTVRFAGAEPIVVAPTPDGTRISIFVPADARQGPVTVTADGGSVSSAKFVVRRAPADLVSTPETGLAGDTVVIQGNNLKGTTSVLFNGVKAGFRVASPNRIVAFVPTAATTGFITVVNPWGTATTPVAFTVDLPV